MVSCKILESCSECIQLFDDVSKLQNLEFTSNPNDENGDTIIERLDSFIENIALLLISLLEGKNNNFILNKMTNSLSFVELKDRMLNVFGKFLKRIDLFPNKKVQNEEEELMPLHKLSKSSVNHKYQILRDLSLSRIE